jgi:transposase
VGKCRAGKATKIMAVADSAGLPIAVSIADGSRHDVALVDQTLDEAVTEHLPSKLIGDKAFDSAHLAGRLQSERDVELIAPKRKGNHRRVQDGRPMRRYKRRWKVERLFGWLKRFRRIAVRWERYAACYLGFVQLGAAVILLRQLTQP